MDLRNALQRHIGDNSDFESHRLCIEKLGIEFGHSIKLLEFDESMQDCNCVMYALGLRFDPASSLLGYFYANTEFLGSLIEQGYVLEREPRIGSLAVYYSNNSEIAHVGITRDDGLIESKWGIGYLYQHGLWEVPSTYGSSIRYFAPISSDDAFELLKKFRPH